MRDKRRETAISPAEWSASSAGISSKAMLESISNSTRCRNQPVWLPDSKVGSWGLANCGVSCVLPSSGEPGAVMGSESAGNREVEITAEEWSKNGAKEWRQKNHEVGKERSGEEWSAVTGKWRTQLSLFRAYRQNCKGFRKEVGWR